MSKNEDRITVIADDRERKSEVIQFLSEMKNVSVAIKHLSPGDYICQRGGLKTRQQAERQA
jgi:ERCC4-type nuclease